MELWDTFLALLKAMAGFGIVLGGWLLIQYFIRRKSGCTGDKDPLDYMPNGCAGCSRKASGQCRGGATKDQKDEHHHEPA